MADFSKVQRSRLKVTLIFGFFGLIICIFPAYIIYKASLASNYELAAAWGAYGVSISAFLGLAGLYVNQETRRPSFVNNTVSNIHIPEMKVIDGEDESDPQTMPI